MSWRAHIQTSILAVAWACSSSVQASAISVAGDPLQELRQTSLAVGSVLRRRLPDWSPEAEARQDQIDGMLAALFDYEAIGRRALGPTWDGLTGAQRHQFLQTFSALTNQAFLTAMNRPDIRVDFESEAISGEFATVLVTTSPSKTTPGSQKRMEYRLARKHQRWLVCDVVVDNVSLVDAYRDEFGRLIRMGGFAELMDRMHQRLDRYRRP